MKTFKIRYEFFNRQSAQPFWDIANAIVVASNEDFAEEHFMYELTSNEIAIISIDEMTTPTVIWAY